MAWLAVAVPASLTIIGALLTLVWLLAGLTTSVAELARRMEKVEQALDSQETRARRRGEWPTSPPSE